MWIKFKNGGNIELSNSDLLTTPHEKIVKKSAYLNIDTWHRIVHEDSKFYVDGKEIE